MSNLEYEAGIGLSDHVVLSYTLNVIPPITKKFKPRYNYHEGDYDAMNTIIAKIEWANELQDMSVDEAWTYLSEILTKLMNEHIPMST